MMHRSLAAYAADTASANDPDIVQLIEAEARSESSIDAMRSYVQRKMRGVGGVDIVAFGSLARREWTDQSDFDYLVVVHEISHAQELRSSLLVAEKARQRLEAGAPGATGMFGTIVSASELVSRIGLETDTNQTLTRRLLMLEESVSLYNQVAHTNFLSNMLDRYVFEYRDRPEKVGVPRFLVNDVVRHWRTVSVDYQAKNWLRVTNEGWGLRWLKLRISRKLAFAGTLAPLLSLDLDGAKPEANVILRLLEPPPLVRLANIGGYVGDEGRAALHEILKIAGRFNAALNSEEFRDEASSVPERGAPTSELFSEMSDAADVLQRGLETLFLETGSPFSSPAKKYLVF